MAVTLPPNPRFGRGVRQIHRPRLLPGINPPEPSGEEWSSHGVSVYCGDARDRYSTWEAPTVIISDGAYGVGGFHGDPPTVDGLPEWYRPHVAEWSRRATPETTLWFWGTELGWATVHPLLKEYGWSYRSCHIWNKGMGHVAGNSNTQTLRRLPVVTEVCVQYAREAEFKVGGRVLSMKDWLRYEWERTGIPLQETNKAAGVLNAATRKYFTKDHLWYYPPPEVFGRLVQYANEHGDARGRPYFSVNGRTSLTPDEWGRMRTKFDCEIGTTNVWSEPALHGEERVKIGAKCVHLNQKPLKLVERIIRLSSDVGDVVWEPFGGLCSGALASLRLGRKCHSAETNMDFYRLATDRLASSIEGRATA